MTMLVTLEQAKSHLRVEHASDDADIELKVHASSAAIINYLKEAGALAFIDTSGDVIMTTDSPPVPAVPQLVQQATLLMVGWMYAMREGEGGIINPAFTQGYLPPPITALLFPLRDPTLA